MSLRIAYLGTYDPAYPRNRVLIDGLRAAGAEVLEYARAARRLAHGGADDHRCGRGQARRRACPRPPLAALPPSRRRRVRRRRGRLPRPPARALRLGGGPLPARAARLRPARLAVRHLRRRPRAAGRRQRRRPPRRRDRPRLVRACPTWCWPTRTRHADYYAGALCACRAAASRWCRSAPCPCPARLGRRPRAPGRRTAARRAVRTLEPAARPADRARRGRGCCATSPSSSSSSATASSPPGSPTRSGAAASSVGRAAERRCRPGACAPGCSAADVCLGVFGTSDKAARVVPNKVYDALAAGRPLVTADSPAARELLGDGRDALLVPAGDGGALAAALRRLGDVGERARLGAAALALYRRRCTPEAVAAALLAALEARCERRASRGRAAPPLVARVPRRPGRVRGGRRLFIARYLRHAWPAVHAYHWRLRPGSARRVGGARALLLPAAAPWSGGSILRALGPAGRRATPHRGHLGASRSSRATCRATSSCS